MWSGLCPAPPRINNELTYPDPTCPLIDLRDPPFGASKMNATCLMNTTNLHTHGLHVSPIGHADNVFDFVEPGADRVMKVHLPCDHMAGTHWCSLAGLEKC